MIARVSLLTVLVLAVAASASPATTDEHIKTETVTYRDGQTALAGYLAYDATADEPRPLVLVVHEWWGLNDYARSRARQLASLGYVAFAVDMYGDGVVAETAQQARELSAPFRSDRELMRRRVRAGLTAVCDHPRVDGDRVGAIGYCFGGTVVLELARSGADVNAVVSFHGGLSTPDADDAKDIRASVLVCSGADDRSVPMSQVAAFVEEMRAGGVDYQVVLYGGAVHAFTNPDSGDDPSDNVAYNAAADRRSWQLMRYFLGRTLETPKPDEGACRNAVNEGSSE
ncbi:MAG: dienelactone hydrolase family protein [Phycisphaerae bacterium]